MASKTSSDEEEYNINPIMRVSKIKHLEFSKHKITKAESAVISNGGSGFGDDYYLGYNCGFEINTFRNFTNSPIYRFDNAGNLVTEYATTVNVVKARPACVFEYTALLSVRPSHSQAKALGIDDRTPWDERFAKAHVRLVSSDFDVDGSAVSGDGCVFVPELGAYFALQMSANTECDPDHESITVDRLLDGDQRTPTDTRYPVVVFVSDKEERAEQVVYSKDGVTISKAHLIRSPIVPKGSVYIRENIYDEQLTFKTNCFRSELGNVVEAGGVRLRHTFALGFDVDIFCQWLKDHTTLPNEFTHDVSAKKRISALEADVKELTTANNHLRAKIARHHKAGHNIKSSLDNAGLPVGKSVRGYISDITDGEAVEPEAPPREPTISEKLTNVSKTIGEVGSNVAKGSEGIVKTVTVGAVICGAIGTALAVAYRLIFGGQRQPSPA